METNNRRIWDRRRRDQCIERTLKHMLWMWKWLCGRNRSSRKSAERARESYGRAVRDGNFILKNASDDCWCWQEQGQSAGWWACYERVDYHDLVAGGYIVCVYTVLTRLLYFIGLHYVILLRYSLMRVETLFTEFNNPLISTSNSSDYNKNTFSELGFYSKLVPKPNYANNFF